MNTNEKIRLIADGEFEVVAKLSVDETTQICRDLRGAKYSLDITCQQRDDNYHRAEKLLAQRDELLTTMHKLACLGNGDKYGNSIGNVIAQEAIAKCEAQP